MQRQIVSAAVANDAQASLGQVSDQVKAFVTNPQSSDTASVDDYKDKLLKHIPAEVVAAYITLDGIIKASTQGTSLKAWLWVAFLLGLIGTPLYLRRLQGVTASGQLWVSTISFIIWVFALGGVFAQYSWYHSWTGSVLLVGYTFLIPLFLGGNPPKVQGAGAQGNNA